MSFYYIKYCHSNSSSFVLVFLKYKYRKLAWWELIPIILKDQIIYHNSILLNKVVTDIHYRFHTTSVYNIWFITQVDVDKAVKAARAAMAFGSPWRTMDASKRGKLIAKFCELLDRDKSYIAVSTNSCFISLI